MPTPLFHYEKAVVMKVSVTLPGVMRSWVTQPGVPSPQPLVWLALLLSGVFPPPAWLVPLPHAYGSPPAVASVSAPRPAANAHTHKMSVIQGLNFPPHALLFHTEMNCS